MGTLITMMAGAQWSLLPQSTHVSLLLGVALVVKCRASPQQSCADVMMHGRPPVKTEDAFGAYATDYATRSHFGVLYNA